MNKVQIKHTEGCNCLEDLTVYMIQKNHMDYELIFFNSWKFHISQFNNEKYSKSDRIGDCIHMNSVVFEEIAELFGLSYSVVDRNSKADMWASLSEALEDRKTVLLGIDGYYVPWNESYQNVHFLQHYCLAVAMDKEHEEIICLDPYFVEGKEVRISLKDFTLGCVLEIQVDNVKETINFGKQDIKKQLTNALEQARDIPANISYFADVVEKYFNVEIEFKDADSLWNAPIIMAVTNVINSRIQFATYLDYISNLIDVDFTGIAKEFRENSSLWNNVRSILFKIAFRNNQMALPILCKKIRKVCEYEKELYSSLLGVVENGNQKDQEVGKLKEQETQIETIRTIQRYYDIKAVDLSSILNNKSFISEDDIMNEDNKLYEGIDHFNLFFKKSELEFADKGLEQWIDLSNKDEDNVFCMQQSIPVESMVCEGMILVGCNIYIESKDVIRVVYEDGTLEELELKFPIADKRQESSEYPIFAKSSAVKLETDKLWNDGREVFLYSKVLYFRTKGKAVKRVILPDNMNLHLYVMKLIGSH